MMKLIKNLWKSEGVLYDDMPLSDGSLNLYYKQFHIGTLWFEQETWFFSYSEQFKKDPIIAPLIQFPDLNKTYKSKDLWPFFASRIPALNQPFHEKKIKKNNIDRNNPLKLLEVFGQKTISNPFRLSAN
jgi:HipA-like protein